MAAEPAGQFGCTASANDDQIYMSISGRGRHLPGDLSSGNVQFGGNFRAIQRLPYLLLNRLSRKRRGAGAHQWHQNLVS
jgi:hypothetical protein